MCVFVCVCMCVCVCVCVCVLQLRLQATVYCWIPHSTLKMYIDKLPSSSVSFSSIFRVGQNRIRIYTPYIYGRIFVEATVSVSVSV